jgi:hypothetical protein
MEGALSGDTVHPQRQGTVPPPAEWGPQESGLDVHEVDQTLEFSKDETWVGKAYVDSEPLSSTWLHCYLASDHDLMVHENTTTDANGDFSLVFRTPAKGPGPGGFGHTYYMAPALELSDHPYERDDGSLKLGESRWPDYGHLSLWEYFDMFRTDDMAMRMLEGASGRGMEVRLEHPDTGPGWEAIVYVGTDYDEGTEDLVPEWTYWSRNRLSGMSAHNGGGTYSDICWYDDGVWRADIVIPENIPSDNLFMWAKISEDGSYANVRSSLAQDFDYSEVVPSPDDEEGQTPEKVLTGLVLVAATAIVAVVITRRQENR